MWKDITTSHQPVEVRLCCCGWLWPGALQSRGMCLHMPADETYHRFIHHQHAPKTSLCQLPPPEVITRLIILHLDNWGGGGAGRNLLWFFMRNVGGNRFVGVNTVLMPVLHDGAVARGEMTDVELKKKGRIVVFIAWFAVWKGSALLHDFFLFAVGAGFVLDDLGDVRPFHRLSCS